MAVPVVLSTLRLPRAVQGGGREVHVLDGARAGAGNVDVAGHGGARGGRGRPGDGDLAADVERRGAEGDRPADDEVIGHVQVPERVGARRRAAQRHVAAVHRGRLIQVLGGVGVGRVLDGGQQGGVDRRPRACGVGPRGRCGRRRVRGGDRRALLGLVDEACLGRLVEVVAEEPHGAGRDEDVGELRGAGVGDLVVRRGVVGGAADLDRPVDLDAQGLHGTCRRRQIRGRVEREPADLGVAGRHGRGPGAAGRDVRGHGAVGDRAAVGVDRIDVAAAVQLDPGIAVGHGLGQRGRERHGDLLDEHALARLRLPRVRSGGGGVDPHPPVAVGVPEHEVGEVDVRDVVVDLVHHRRAGRELAVERGLELRLREPGRAGRGGRHGAGSHLGHLDGGVQRRLAAVEGLGPVARDLRRLALVGDDEHQGAGEHGQRGDHADEHDEGRSCLVRVPAHDGPPSSRWRCGGGWCWSSR